MTIRKTAVTVAFAAAVVVLIQGQRAQAAFTDNLADLVANDGTLTIGDKTFSGFNFVESGLNGFSASSIIVTASVSPSDSSVDLLSFSGSMVLAGSTFATADLLLGYTVTASDGLIGMIDQKYTGGADNGSILINETATSVGAPTGHSQLSTVDVSDPNIYPDSPGTYNPVTHQFDTGELDLLPIDPAQSQLIVTKDLAFAILDAPPGGVSVVSVSEVEQSFHQVAVPEATTIIAGALLLLPFGASTLRIVRKNHIV